MKILFVSDSYYPHINGVYYFVCRIGPLLLENGHEVAVIAPSDTMHYSVQKIDGLNVHGLPSISSMIYPTIRIPILFMMRKRIRKIIGQFNPDIIHIQDHFAICKAVVGVNRKLHIPIIGSNHMMPENFTVLLKKPFLKKLLENYIWKEFVKVYNQLAIVTTPTETGVNIIKHRLVNPSIAISSGIDLVHFNPDGETQTIRRKYGIPDKPVLVYAGRLDPEKHIEEILQAVSIALKNIDFSLVLVGRGISKNALQQMAIELKISEHVIFTGFVPDEDLPYFYKLGTAFVIASNAELLSLVSLQAMASGLPLIAVNAGALPELVLHGQNGYLYEEGDIQALAEYIEKTISDEPLNISMRKKSLELIRKHDINQTLVSFENLYKNFMKP